MRLRLLGQVALRHSGHTPDAILQQPKRLALLAYLATQPRGRVKQRDTLLGLLWPELPDDRARHSLRQALYVLRHELGDSIVRNRGDTVWLEHRNMWCDVTAFRDAITDQRVADAAALYGGEFMDGFFVSGASAEFDQWLDLERQRLRASAGQVFGRLRASAEDDQDLSAALGWAEQATRVSPLDESAVRHEIRLLERSGNRAAAMGRYQVFAATLRHEFGIVPSPETRAMVDQIRSEGGPVQEQSRVEESRREQRWARRSAMEPRASAVGLRSSGRSPVPRGSI